MIVVNSLERLSVSCAVTTSPSSLNKLRDIIWLDSIKSVDWLYSVPSSISLTRLALHSFTNEYAFARLTISSSELDGGSVRRCCCTGSSWCLASMCRLDPFCNSLLCVLASLAAWNETLVDCINGLLCGVHSHARVNIRLLIRLKVSLLSLIKLELLEAFFKCFLHIELISRQFLILKKDTLCLLLLLAKALSERRNHLVAPIYLDLDKSFNLVHNICSCKQVTSVQQFK